MALLDTAAIIDEHLAAISQAITDHVATDLEGMTPEHYARYQEEVKRCCEQAERQAEALTFWVARLLKAKGKTVKP